MRPHHAHGPDAAETQSVERRLEALLGTFGDRMVQRAERMLGEDLDVLALSLTGPAALLPAPPIAFNR